MHLVLRLRSQHHHCRLPGAVFPPELILQILGFPNRLNERCRGGPSIARDPEAGPSGNARGIEPVPSVLYFGVFGFILRAEDDKFWAAIGVLAKTVPLDQILEGPGLRLCNSATAAWNLLPRPRKNGNGCIDVFKGACMHRGGCSKPFIRFPPHNYVSPCCCKPMWSGGMCVDCRE